VRIALAVSAIARESETINRVRSTVPLALRDASCEMLARVRAVAVSPRHCCAVAASGTVNSAIAQAKRRCRNPNGREGMMKVNVSLRAKSRYHSSRCSSYSGDEYGGAA
jgi:hypothetical protein